MADKEKKKSKSKKKNKKELERLAREEEERKKKEEEERLRLEEEERQRLEAERLAKEAEEKRKEEERLRKEEEARQAALAERIEVVEEEEEGGEGEKEGKIRPEDRLFEYNGKMIKPKLVRSDISDEMKERAFEVGFEAVKKFMAEKEMSEYIKNIFDNEFEPEWQVIVGKDFSVAFSFEIENFVFFQIEDCYFLYYKL